MSIPHRIQLKFYINDADTVDIEQFINVFHSWIQQQKITDTMLMDVVDYKHLPDGPGIILIGAQADYGIDKFGPLGLLYTRKREMADTFEQSLRLALGQAVTAAKLIEADTDVRFSTTAVDVLLADKLVAPNTDEAFNQFSGDILTVFAATLDNGEMITVERVDNDPRLPLHVRVQLPETTTLDELTKGAAQPA